MVMKTFNFDVMIIGAGPSGLAAALYAKRAGLSVAVIEKNVVGGQLQLADRVDNYPGVASISGVDLAVSMLAQAENAGAEFFYGAPHALDLAASPKVIRLAAQTLTARFVILAMGTSAKKLGLKEEESLVGSGVSYCATCDGMFFKGKDVMVVGGTQKAVQEVAYLQPLVNKIYLVDKGALDHLNLPHIEKIENAEVIELHGKPLQKVRLSLKSGTTREVAVSGLFCAMGASPNTFGVTAQISLDEKGYILTDATLKTSLDGVYATGDVRKGALKQIITACADGALAATEVIKQNNKYKLR